MIALAIRTGIAPHHWERAGGRAIATAFDLLAEADRADQEQPADGPVMSG